MPDLKAFRKVFMENSAGQKVLADLMDFTDFFSSPDYDERWDARKSGQRDVILFILDSLGLGQSLERIVQGLAKVPVDPEPKLQEETER